MDCLSLVDKLGRKQTKNKISASLDNFPVRVRRQDATIENVMLMDELVRFLDAVEPDAVKKYLSYPQSCEFNQTALKHIQGFPEEARWRADMQTQKHVGLKDQEQALKEQWRKKALGASGETKTSQALERLFQARPSLLLNGIETEKMLRVARESAKYSFGQSKKQVPSHLGHLVSLTGEERLLADALGFDLAQLESEVNCLTALTPQTPNISRNDLLTSVTLKKARPAFWLLEDGERSKYTKTLTRAVNQMYDKSKRDLSPDEIANFLTRFFLDLVEKKDEFDFFMLDRNSSSAIQVEVKSYPQDSIVSHEGLKGALASANMQLGKGDKFWENVLAPGAKLSSSWSKLNIVCFPEVSSRQPFRNLGIDDRRLKYILTAEELESGEWLKELCLADSQATEEEYKRLLAICIGSQYVAFNCQIFDFEEEHKDTHTRLVGGRMLGDVAGVGGEEVPQDGETLIKFSDLKEKPLGHTWSILFWTQKQLNLLAMLRTNQNLVLCGDYGSGKTSLLVCAALEASKDPNFKVLFIPTTNMYNANSKHTEFILDEAVRMKFYGTCIEVVTLGELRKVHGGNMLEEEDDRHYLIREFVQTRNQPMKVFIDELPVFQIDLERILEGENTQLADLLRVLETHSSQTWIALSTLSLLDNSEDPDKPHLPEDKTRTQTFLKAGFSQGNILHSFLTRNTSFTPHQLNLRVRNSSSIGASAPEHISEFSTDAENFQTSVIRGASSASTVVGVRPTFIDMGGVLDADFSLGLQDALQRVLQLKQPPTEHVAILCGEGVPMNLVSQTVNKLGYCPIMLPSKPSDSDMQQLKGWLLGTGGLLVTSNLQFAGMEAHTCVFITKKISEETGARSGLLRATTRLVVISYSENVKQEEILKHFFVDQTVAVRRKISKVQMDKGDIRLKKREAFANLKQKIQEAKSACQTDGISSEMHRDLQKNLQEYLALKLKAQDTGSTYNSHHTGEQSCDGKFHDNLIQGLFDGTLSENVLQLVDQEIGLSRSLEFGLLSFNPSGHRQLTIRITSPFLDDLLIWLKREVSQMNLEDKFYSYLQFVEREKEQLDKPPPELLAEIRSRAADYIAHRLEATTSCIQGFPKSCMTRIAKHELVSYMDNVLPSDRQVGIDRMLLNMNNQNQHIPVFLKILQQNSFTNEEHLSWGVKEVDSWKVIMKLL